MKEYFLGQHCLVYNISDELSLSDNLKILKIYIDIFEDKEFCAKYNIYDIVPTYNSVAFHFDYNDVLMFKESISQRIKVVNYEQNIKSSIHIVEVDYNGEDLQKASKILNLEVKEIIKRHSQVEYHIAMLGFKPYLPYLLGLDHSIAIPRLAFPRNRIPAGSVGIGGAQTTIFPEQTPSGWNIIGKSNFSGFKSLRPGDKMIFKEV